jgi:hypothetical protein
MITLQISIGFNMVFLQRGHRPTQQAVCQALNEESVFDQSPVKIDILIKYKSLKTTPLMYKDSTGCYHHINIAINNGEYSVQQCLLHVYHFWIHMHSHVFPTHFDECQFFAMTLASTASEKWPEVCFALDKGTNYLKAVLSKRKKAFAAAWFKPKKGK